MTFDIQGARKAGYSEQEIDSFLSKKKQNLISPPSSNVQWKDYGYGLREDKTPKGMGYFGEMPMQDKSHKIMTELGAEGDINGKRTHYPLIVPTLTAAEIDHLARGEKPTKQIYIKAEDWARHRIEEGKSPFAHPDEEGQTPLPNANKKSFDFQAAKKAGYTEQEINKFLNKRNKSQESSLARNLMQATIGGTKGALYASPAGAPVALGEASYPGALQNVISELMESDIEQQQRFPGELHPLNREKVEEAAHKAEEKYLGKGGLAEGAITAPYRAAGIETEPQSPSEKAIQGISELFNLFKSGKLTPENIKKTLGGALTGEATKQTLQQAGVPEPIASLGSLGVAAVTPHIQPTVKTEAKMPGGLTEVRAIEAKVPERGRITKERQAKTINKLNEEASNLFKESAEKHISLKQKLEQGFNFEGDFEKRFGKLESAAKKANPDINTSDLNRFLRETSEKYIGIPRPDKEVASIKKDIKAYSKNPKTELEELYNIYRSNNRKQRSIRESALLKGSQKEYSDFLAGMNKKIFDSVEKTLPADSAWIKNFKNLNAEYSQWIKSQQALEQTKKLFGETPDPKVVARLANDIKSQKKLALSMGKEGSEEIIQIARDLQKALKTIKKIPVREVTHWEKYIPFSFLIPHAGVPLSISAGIVKGHDAAKRLYGLMLTSPAKRKLYSASIKAIESGDMKAYLAATQKLAAEFTNLKED